MTPRDPPHEVIQQAIPAPTFDAALEPHTPPRPPTPSAAAGRGRTSPVLLSPVHLSGETTPVPFSWQARRAREAHRPPIHHEAKYSGESRSLRLPAPQGVQRSYSSLDVFEDGVEREIAESEISGSDNDFVPELTPNARERREASSSDSSDSPAPLTAKQKGKARQATPYAGPDELSAPKNSATGRGRLPQTTIRTFREFGEVTRQRAQELADLHLVNLATVMRHASLGAGSETRAPSDCNTFKSIFSAETLHETGGVSYVFLFMY